MEPLVEKQVRFGQLRGDVELAPESPFAAGKYRFGLAAVSTQGLGHAVDAVKIGARTAIPSLLLCLAKRIAHQVLKLDRIFAVRLVQRRCGLVVKGDSTSFRRVKIGEFSDVITCDHSGLLCRFDIQ